MNDGDVIQDIAAEDSPGLVDDQEAAFKSTAQKDEIKIDGRDEAAIAVEDYQFTAGIRFAPPFRSSHGYE